MIPQAGEEYLRFSAELIDLETLKIEAGDKATPYLLSPEDLELLIEMTGYDSAGGINLFNTVDCALLNMQNISNRRWTDTGFAFTTSATTGLTKKLRLLSVFRSPGYYTLSAKVRTTQAVNVTLNLEINGTSEDFIISTTPTIISMTAYVESIVQNKFPTFTTTVGAETIYIDELMVEFGRNASPYAPAPRDIPAKIDVAVNNIKITADKISFTNQSGTSFADMFNDPATGNPTLKGEFIEADNLTAAALKLKFSELTNDTISVNDSTPANINGTNKTIILPCDQAAYEGKTITVFNDRKWIRQQNVSEIAGCTVIKCENGIGNGLTDIAKKEFQDGVWGGVGSAGTRAGRYGSSSDANKIQEYLFTEITDDPEYMHIYGGAVQLTCAKEHIYDTTLEDWKTVLRWVVTGGKFYHVQDYVEQPVLFLVSGNHTRYIVTDKVNSLTAATASTVYLSNSQETVVLGSGFNLPIKLPSRCVLGKEIKIVNKSGSSRTVTCHDMDLTGQGYIREMGSATNKTSQTIENGTTYVFTRISAQRWEYYLL